MSDSLRIYMNDQLALGVVWREVAQRAARENRASDYGEPLARVAAGITDDVATFERIMERVGLRKDPVKTRFAVLADRLGRFKFGGIGRGYSALSRFEELEFLAMGIDGKKILWTTLRDLTPIPGRLPELDFDHLLERAQQQRDELEPWRARAGREAFGGGGAAS